MAKSDRQTIQKRIQEIYQLMCSGASSNDIVQYGSESWNISHRMMYKLMKYAMKYIKEKNDKNIEELRFEACSRFDKLYAKLYKQERFGEAGKIQAMKNKINGLEIQKIEVTGDLKSKVEFNILGIDAKDKDRNTE